MELCRNNQSPMILGPTSSGSRTLYQGTIILYDLFDTVCIIPGIYFIVIRFHWRGTNIILYDLYDLYDLYHIYCII